MCLCLGWAEWDCVRMAEMAGESEIRAGERASNWKTKRRGRVSGGRLKREVQKHRWWQREKRRHLGWFQSNVPKNREKHSSKTIKEMKRRGHLCWSSENGGNDWTFEFEYSNKITGQVSVVNLFYALCLTCVEKQTLQPMPFESFRIYVTLTSFRQFSHIFNQQYTTNDMYPRWKIVE